MIKHILFDLDGTLIHFDHHLFMENYLNLLGRKFASITDPKIFANHVLTATGHMLKNIEHTKTNADVFWQYIDQNVDISRTTLNPLIDEFYQNDFNELKKMVTVPKILPILNNLIEKAIPVSLATNPVFPLIAVKSRLQWGGLDHIPFQRITHYENSHFCKPQLAYYQEILDAIDLSPENVLMIGNDVHEDLVAGELGIKTYLLTDFIINKDNRPIKSNYIGTVDQLAKDLPKILA
ncbi:HAD family hydrolase [Anaerosinus sp.]